MRTEVAPARASVRSFAVYAEYEITIQTRSNENHSTLPEILSDTVSADLEFPLRLIELRVTELPSHVFRAVGLYEPLNMSMPGFFAPLLKAQLMMPRRITNLPAGHSSLVIFLGKSCLH